MDKLSSWEASFNSIRICAPAVQPTQEETSAPEDTSDWSDIENEDTVDTGFYEPDATNLDHTNRMGTLIGSGQPPPPESMQFRTAETKQESHEPSELIIVTVDMEDAIAVQQEFSAYGIRVKRRQKLSNLGLVISTLGLPSGELADQVLAG